MKTFRKHLNRKLPGKEFKEMYDEERELLEFSLKLLEARKKMGLTQQEVAHRAQITQQQLSRLESGMNCNMATFLRVCHALHVRLNLKHNEFKYYVNTNAQRNGFHEIHKYSCSYMPDKRNRKYLGSFASSNEAVNEAKRFYSKVDFCFYCLGGSSQIETYSASPGS
jgi:transcriptional regulator with XRE-family HTH domain